KTFSKARKMLWQRPDMAHKLLGMITDSTVNYLQRQIDAGVHLLQIFDSWAGILSAEQYRTFGIPYLEKICKAIDLKVPVTLFAKGAHFSIRDLALLECNTIVLDWNMPVNLARQMRSEERRVGKEERTRR